MLKKEFENLIGREVSDNEYENANYIYDLTDIEKGDFVKDWKKHEDSAIIDDLATILTAKKKVIETLKSRQKSAAEQLLEKAYDLVNSSLRQIACEMVGEKAVVMFALKNGYGLMVEDEEYLTEMLERQY